MKRSLGKVGSEMSSIPVTGDPTERDAFVFSFGAYGWTRLAVFAGSLDEALELSFEWLDENAPGILTCINYAEAADELGLTWDPNCEHELSSLNEERVRERAEADMTICSHTTLKNGDAIPSWEWTARDATTEELAELRGRFCADCGESLGADPVAWPLCEQCRLDWADSLASDLRDATIGLDEPTDVRVQVRDWGSGYLIHTGSADYDQDHTGSWGASELEPVLSPSEAKRLALDLLDQAADMAAEGSS